MNRLFVRFAYDEFLCKASAEQIDLLCRAAAKNHEGEARVNVAQQQFYCNLRAKIRFDRYT